MRFFPRLRPSLRAMLFGAVLLPVAATAQGEAPAPPAALDPYVQDGSFEPGDYRWMRGRFADASPADRLAFDSVMAWQKACFDQGMASARAAIAALGVDPSRLETGAYGSQLCSEVALSIPHEAQIASWPQFERDLAAARPIADTYLFAIRNAGTGASPDGSLRTRLALRPVAEQTLRRAMNWGKGNAADAPALPDGARPILMALLGRALVVEDRANTRWLDKVMAEEGWPGIPAVGEGGAAMAWLMAQHADHDPAFQFRVLRAIEPLAAKGEVSPRNHAYLYDRVMLKIAGRQRYGTQATCADGARVPRLLEDAGKVDTLRRAIGLEPVADYIAGMNRSFGPCPPDPVSTSKPRG